MGTRAENEGESEGATIEAAPGDTIVIREPDPQETPGEVIEAHVVARLAEEHAEAAADAVEELEERSEQWQTEQASRLNALEMQLQSMTPEALAEQLAPMLANSEPFRQQMLSALNQQAASSENSSPLTTEEAETVEALETLAENPEAVEAAAEAMTNTSETLTEASSETLTEAPDESPVESQAPLAAVQVVAEKRVRFV